MATWATDVRGLNLARHVPTEAEQRMGRLIARRWSKWSPILLLELRKRPQPAGYVAREMLRLENVHRARIFRLVEHYRAKDSRHQCSRIAEYNTDDPRILEAEFERKLADAVNKRRAHAAGRARREREANAES